MSLIEVTASGIRRAVTRDWVPEVPVALEFNGLAYAVMMATPRDLEDFAAGFAIAEGLASSTMDITDSAVAEVEHGWVVRTALTGLGIDKLGERVRTRVAESSCGLCGIENLEALARPLPPVARHAAIAIGRELGRRMPKQVTTSWWKEERGERVFVDFNQNAKDRTVASAYSVRATPDARVSTPLIPTTPCPARASTRSEVARQLELTRDGSRTT